jgi:hypothetical protein
MRASLLPQWLLAIACLCGVIAAIAYGGGAEAQQPQPAPSGSVPSPDPMGPDPAPPVPGTVPGPLPAPDPNAPPPPAPVPGQVPHGPDHGLYPMFGNEMLPLKFMPPGTGASPMPSDEIFPPQTLTIRFNHAWHVKQLKQTCKVCHAAAYKSKKSKDRLMPDPAKTCDNCHDSDHSVLTKVTGGTEDPNGKCEFCHMGEGAGADFRVAKMVIPDPNLRMNHKAHLDRNIDCAQCHGMIAEVELATREQLPRMAGCFTCHAKSGSAQGQAKGHCTNCHLTEPSGLLLTSFDSGSLQPPTWLHGAAHTPDWIERHKNVAGAASELCGSCHSNKFCADCHDGKVRPRRVHPNDWISMHPEAGRQDNPRCTSCHQLQTFCADCHRRTGVARDVASDNRLAGRRFHPPPEEWSTAPRGPRHHAWEAERNLNACVSCHTERDCATCHATKGVRGGSGVNPHPLGFESKCGLAFSRNPRPCLVCHSSNDPLLAPCQD